MSDYEPYYISPPLRIYSNHDPQKMYVNFPGIIWDKHPTNSLESPCVVVCPAVAERLLRPLGWKLYKQTHEFDEFNRWLLHHPEDLRQLIASRFMLCVQQSPKKNGRPADGAIWISPTTPKFDEVITVLLAERFDLKKGFWVWAVLCDADA